MSLNPSAFLVTGINGDSASRSGLMEKPVLKNPLAKQRKPLRPQRPQEQDSKSS